MKICKVCQGDPKPDCEFPKRSKGGYGLTCKACEAENAKRKRREKAEELKEADRILYEIEKPAIVIPGQNYKGKCFEICEPNENYLFPAWRK